MAQKLFGSPYLQGTVLKEIKTRRNGSEVNKKPSTAMTPAVTPSH